MSIKFVAPVAIVTALVAMGGAAHAAVSPTVKCEAARLKLAGKKAAALAKCDAKATAKGITVAVACPDNKAATAFTSGWSKATTKANGACPDADVNAIEDKVDAHDTDLQGLLGLAQSKCTSAEFKATGKKASCILGAYAKAVTKGLPLSDPGVETSVGNCETKFSAAWGKAGDKGPCNTTADATTIEENIDAFADDVFAELVPAPPAAGTFDLTTVAGSGACGSISPGTAPKRLAGNPSSTLTCGGLDIGGGGSTVAEGATPEGGINRYMRDSCPGGACTVSAVSSSGLPATVDCSKAGCPFGTPLPIANGVFSTCVQNTFASDASGTLDLNAGTASLNINLASHIWLTGNGTQPCPRCSGSGSPAAPGSGTCDRGANAGNACTTTSPVGLSKDCLPGVESADLGSISVDLTPFATGTSSKTDPGGNFCGQAAGHTGCFGTASCTAITENGAVASPLPITVGTPSSITLGSVFCIPAAPLPGGATVNAAADLPGPGATAVPYTITLYP